MNKLCKIMSIIAVMMIVISVSISAMAYTNDDVISYVTKAHTVNGRTVQLSKSQRESLKKYLQENPVTDAEANEIIDKLDTAKAKLDNSGATNLSQVSDSIKAEVVSLVKEAGRIAGLDVQVDTVNETVTIKDSNGNVIIGATSYSQFNVDAKKSSTTGKDSATSTSSNQSSSKSSSKSGSTKKLVYTGRDYTLAIKTLVAIVAIAIAGVVAKKYAK